MNRKFKITIYSISVIILYILLALKINSPAEWWQVLTTSEKDLGIICYPIKSPREEKPTQIKVLLPRNYNPAQSYKVLYILPVSPQILDPWWMNGIRVIAKWDVATKYNVICVYPTFTRAPWFADHPNNKRIHQESYFIKDVVPFIDNKFNTIKSWEGRYLLGFSRSGFGALTLLLRHPDLFGGAASWDGTLAFDFSHNPSARLKEIFETEEHFNEYYIPFLVRKQAKTLRQEKPRIVLMGYSFPNTRQQTEFIHKILLKEEILHIFDLSTKRKHVWNSDWMPLAVDYLLRDQREK